MKTPLRSSFIKRNKYLFIIVIVSLLPLVPYFITSQNLHTHDGLVHLARLAAYFKALEDWSIPVRFAGYLNYGYGLPLFNFIYQFPYWVGSLFLLLGFSLVNAFKISIAASFILSGLFMYLFSKEYFEDQKKALLITTFYQFAPFRMVELLVRGSYGEVYTYAFLPLVLYGLTLMSKKISIKGILVTSFAVFFLIVSHNSVSLMFFGASALFVLFVNTQVKKIIASFLSLLFGLSLSAFYWMPALLEHKYTYGDLFMSKLYLSYFPSFINFFIPNFNNNPSLQSTGISTYLGLFQGIAIFTGILVLLRNKVKRQNIKRILYYSFTLIVISFFFMLPISKFIWGSEMLSLIRQFQFPWRFLALIVLATSILSISLPIISKKLQNGWAYYLLITLTILSVAFYWKASLGYDKINEDYYWNFPLNTTYYGETDVIWSAGPAKSYPKQRVEFISGNGYISNFTKSNSRQTFSLNAFSDAQIVSHTQYFPGWTVKIDGKKTPIQFQDANHRGEIVFSVDKGIHKVTVSFNESKIRFLSDIITVISFLSIFCLVVLRKKIFR